jgi:hypothetical protein
MKLCRDQFVKNASIGPDALVEFYCTRKAGHAGKHSCEVQSLRRESDKGWVNDGFPMDDVSDGEGTRKVGILSW